MKTNPRTTLIAAAIVVAGLVLGACGHRTDDATPTTRAVDGHRSASAPAFAVAHGAQDPSGTTVPAPPVTTIEPPVTSPPSTPGGSPTTVVEGHDPAAPTASPVAGLSPEQLDDVVDEPVTAPAVDARRPLAERVEVPGVAPRWRVRVPVDNAVRSSRATVQVGGRDLGIAIAAPDAISVVAVTPDPAGLVDGAAVTVRWGDGDPVAAGTLEVRS